jgi:murein DD-endopeptidase MepM/ murein hydrolase activator NlpD
VRWKSRNVWTVARLSRLGLLSGLIFLFVCVTQPDWLPLASASAPNRRPPKTLAMPVRTGVLSGASGLLFPVPSVSPDSMANSFADPRGSRVHRAVDIMAPRNSEIVAVDDGVIAKLMVSAKGGLSIYEWNADRTLVYFYAHLQSYAPGLEEGQTVRRGQVIGYVGTTGNAPPNTPHLHFAISRVEEKDRWWGGVPVDPYPIWR